MKTPLLLWVMLVMAGCSSAPQLLESRAAPLHWWFSSDSTCIFVVPQTENNQVPKYYQQLAVAVQYQSGECDSVLFRQISLPLTVNIHSTKIESIRVWGLSHPVFTTVIIFGAVVAFGFYFLLVLSHAFKT
jgi:hypothetical protein